MDEVKRQPIPPEPAPEDVTLEPRQWLYPSAGTLSMPAEVLPLGSEPVTP